MFASLPVGTYQINGPGGADVSQFNATLKVPASLTWTNQTAVSATAINRANPLTITWTGGDPASFAFIEGVSSVPASLATAITATFTCVAPIAAGSFTIPSAVLASLPASTSSAGSFGTLLLGSTTAPQPFTAPGLDAAFAFASTLTGGSVTFQ